jgi:hypothetical protein
MGVDGTALTTLAIAAPAYGTLSTPIAVNAGRIYFSGLYGGTSTYAGLFSADLDGKNERLVTKGVTPVHFIADDQFVYFTTGGPAYRVPIDGGEARVIAAVPAEVGSCCWYQDIAQDSEFVYVALDATIGGIWKVAK